MLTDLSIRKLLAPRRRSAWSTPTARSPAVLYHSTVGRDKLGPALSSRCARASSRSDRSPLSTSRLPGERPRKPADGLPGAKTRLRINRSPGPPPRSSSRFERSGRARRGAVRRAAREGGHAGLEETERLLEQNVVDQWRGSRLSHIGRADIHNLLDVITDRGPDRRESRVRAARKVLAGAVGRGIIERSPCEGVTAPSSERGRARERVLADDELKLVWKAADSIGWPFGPIVKLLLLTGARRDEVAQMEWREVDLDRAVWTLPASRSKNRREHAIPLSDMALDVLRSLPRIERSGFVFTTNARTPVSGFSKAKPALDRAMAELAGEGASPIPGWVLHDLRRTVATNLQRLGVRLEVTEAVLNHVSGSRAGIVGVYQQHEYAVGKAPSARCMGKEARDDRQRRRGV